MRPAQQLVVGMPVRVLPNGRVQHAMPGRVVGFEGSHVLVQFNGPHKAVTKCDLARVSVWQKGLANDAARLQGRKTS